MQSAVLVLNAGSSSLKFALFGLPAFDPLCRGQIDAIVSTPRFSITGTVAAPLAQTGPPPPAGHAPATTWLVERLRQGLPGYDIAGAGHRVVHGGARFIAPVRVDPAILAELAALAKLAPLHAPHNVAAIRAVDAAWPGLPQVACFDTAFHHTQDRLARIYPLPRALTEEGLVRYGFHGLSYEYVASQLPHHLGPRADGRVVVAHLGNGASLCAMLARRSVATTMGFTPLDGLMMGTRTGAIDPGILLHLITERAMTPAEVKDLLYHRSGLLGVSGISSDVRALEESGEPAAVEALELFAYRVAREIGSLAAALGGLDALVFTGGIGENGVAMRRRIAARSAWTGLELDHEANARGDTRISAAGSPIDALVIATDEEIVVARAVRRLLAGG